MARAQSSSMDDGAHGTERREQGQRVGTGISRKEIDHGGAEDQHRIGVLQLGTHPPCEQRAGDCFGNDRTGLVGETTGGCERSSGNVVK